MNSRRLSRELALQVLFQQEFSPQATAEKSLETLRNSFDTESKEWNYALELLKGVEHYRQKIDSLIQNASAHWSLKRMALVDLSIMRIAVFEIQFANPQIPPAVAINEAVEISKKYGSLDSSAFVNGILDQIMKQ